MGIRLTPAQAAKLLGARPKKKEFVPDTVPLPVTFVVKGPPRTKKNSSRIVNAGRFKKLLPSEAFVAWNDITQPQLAVVLRSFPEMPITRDVNMKALFFRQKNSGDAVGFYQALADALEEAGILENDRQVVSWDGSRLLKDAENPRIIVTIQEAI